MGKKEDLAAHIRAIKRAWEEMEPGRAERASLSRIRYLEQQAEKLESKPELDKTDKETGTSTVERSRPSTQGSLTQGK
ncbi:unnamed protein product [Echinostoma caproni]|uniref:Uncharacterized protein n=1 Tax=Echinostoma caproni TaxID=27848 RepID=A0A3P8GTK7_9TREM|nr:unnamed protein product [Echinostoma caproni]